VDQEGIVPPLPAVPGERKKTNEFRDISSKQERELLSSEEHPLGPSSHATSTSFLSRSFDEKTVLMATKNKKLLKIILLAVAAGVAGALGLFIF
jgi:hypothetical protein